MPAQPHVSLIAIREHGPCQESWKKLLSALGKTQPDDDPLPLLTILDILGVEDALWCLRALGLEWEQWCRLLACDLAEPALKHTSDPRPAEAISVARRYVRGAATEDDLAAARDAAAADADAAWAAWAAADAADAAALAEQERILRRAIEEGAG